jgi:hypothetical protein
VKISDCGSVGHEEHCNCDVVVSTIAKVNYYPQEVRLADIVMRAYGLDDPMESRSNFAAVYEAVTAAHDAAVRLRGREDKLPEVHSTRREIIRLLNDGESILDVPDEVGLDLVDCVRYLTNNVASVLWAWDEDDWLFAEGLLLSADSHSVRGIGKILNIPDGPAKTLIHAYGKTTRRPEHEVAARLRKLILTHPTASNTELAELSALEGIERSPDNIRRFRNRMITNGELERDMGGSGHVETFRSA